MITQNFPDRPRTSVLLILSGALPLVLLLFLFLTLGYPSPTASAATTKIGLIADVGILADNGWNWLSYQGLLRAEQDFGVVGTVYTTTSEADLAPNLQQCAMDGNALCIAIGFRAADAIQDVAPAHPNTKFAILDFAFADYPTNVRGVQFYVNEAAYLAGVLAGSMSQTKIVGDIGGMEIPPVTAFTLPFQNGARCTIPGATTLLTYTNDFGNPELGAQVAQSLIAQGADVIFSPAGPTGVGAVMTATQSGKWAIGVDVDFYDTIFDHGTVTGSDKVLTSVVKKVDNGVYLTIRDVVSNTFTAGTVSYGLAAEGAGLAPYHEADSAIPVSLKARIEQVEQDIIAGKTDVNSTLCRRYLYLPVIKK